jgi:hypothetical protein
VGTESGDVARILSDVFRAAGQLLWVAGALVGPDRVTGRSPFGFGNDRVVGLAVVAQVGGELCAGAVTLLDVGNLYATAALLRQLVEVEYLAWAFAEDDEEAAAWLRSTKEERMQIWQPRHVRGRSAGRFRAQDYGHHCDIGGHPTPDARRALPDHETIPACVWWGELATHGAGAWGYIARAAEKLGHPLKGTALEEVVAAWRSRSSGGLGPLPGGPTA